MLRKTLIALATMSLIFFIQGCDGGGPRERFCEECEIEEVVAKMGTGWTAEEMQKALKANGCTNPTQIVYEHEGEVKKLLVLTRKGWRWVTVVGLLEVEPKDSVPSDP